MLFLTKLHQNNFVTSNLLGSFGALYYLIKLVLNYFKITQPLAHYFILIKTQKTLMIK